DLKVLAGGDMCEIGDRGINVSGEQKARISLARCCYSDSDIVVMDDPIAAVDSHVGKALFHKCIASYLKGKTRILVTNATQYLHKCDYIIVLENQTISHQGTYEELKAQNIDLMALLTEEDGSSSFSAARRTASKREEEDKKEEKSVVNEEENEEDKKEEKSVVNEEDNEEDKKEKKADEAEKEKDPLVKVGVNLTVEPHEKVGVVGRTGAGKSTMMIALFRITDLCEGSIAIDGIDLATLGLEDVRRALCIIPQDPVLFSASVRFNLDPFNEASDENIWSVLEQVELKDAIERLPRGLDDDVQEGGSNFSVGERQLICMARALLKHPKILIMDEATASLDNETDTHLQHMIRKQFATCTGLTIAHRLNTIMDAHRVCVMDKGMVAEYDTPANLLRKEGGIFRDMVIAANDPTLFDMVPGCEDMKELLKKEDAEESPKVENM
ncbi:ABC transporter, partial [Blastocystis sp. ATCC 50177/Nand II]